MKVVEQQGFNIVMQDTKDTFADVPLNLPKPKTRLEFPKEWLKPKEEIAQ